MENKKIFISGGAGYLGRAIIARYYKNNEITCYSRDEAKHYLLKKKYPKIKCIVGDVRDLDRLNRGVKGHDVGIFAASLKQISACDENPIEAIKTIILGAINSRISAEDNNLESACFISSDKACSATTIYGGCKYVAEQSFIVNSSNTRLTSCRYGNVTNSTGSIIPLIKDAINNNYTLELFSKDMTRFMLDVEDAVDLIEYSLNLKGCVIVPDINSFKVKDLFNIYSKRCGLKFKITSPRVGEKIHESMISQEESLRTLKSDKFYIINPSIKSNQNLFINNEYCSKDYVLDKEKLEQILSSKSFYL